MDKEYNIPTDKMVQKLLFDYCVETLNCVGLADGYECAELCPVHMAKGYRKIEGEPPDTKLHDSLIGDPDRFVFDIT